MDDAGISRDDIDYINAHGTSTPIGDAQRDARDQGRARRGEGAPDADLLDEGRDGPLPGRVRARSRRSPPSLAVQRDVVPPTINYEAADPECDLDYIPNESREWTTDVALSNNFGFGGHNACLVFTKFAG